VAALGNETISLNTFLKFTIPYFNTANTNYHSDYSKQGFPVYLANYSSTDLGLGLALG
jgi:hypothetical protein